VLATLARPLAHARRSQTVAVIQVVWHSDAMATAVDACVALRSRSLEARTRYIKIAEQAARDPDTETERRAVLENCVAWLELFYVGALAWEAIHQLGIRSLEELRAKIAEVDQHVEAALPDAAVICQRFGQLFGDLPDGEELARDEWLSIEWAQAVRSLDAIAAECPIDHIEDLGRRLDPQLGHRARNLYDALRAFVRRHDSEHAEIVRIVGEQYQRGNLRLRDAARLLGMSTSDAVFELEQDGYSRPVSAIALTDDERQAVYQRLRQRRLERTEVPIVDLDLVERDVIASERIESVDARAWIRGR
jgi:hypothetical protein